MELEYEILNMISVSILLKLLGLTTNHLSALKFFELGNLVRGQGPWNLIHWLVGGIIAKLYKSS